MSEYNIKDKGLKKDSEATSAVSTITYEVENAHVKDLKKEDINKQIIKLQEKNKFPKNLQYVDSFYDPKTSSSGTAFLDLNTGNVVVGFAGTNWDNGKLEGLKDVGQWGNIATTANSSNAAYFNASNEFMNGLKAQGYNIDTVTGHSLGGRNGAIMGMAYSVPNIVLYNAAPLMNSLFRVPSPANLANVNELKNMIKLYDGNLIYFVSEKDPLNLAAGIGNTSLYPGKIYVMKNGKAHDVTGFLTKKEQAFIREHTPNINRIAQAVKKVYDNTSKKLNDLVNLRLKFLKSGGGLSASEEIYLDASEALILTQGMRDTLQVEIDDIKQMYREGSDDADTGWTNTLKTGEAVGTSLAHGEVLSALDVGGATETVIRTQPKQEYEQKISELSSIQQEYIGLIGQIKAAINEQVQADQNLARQIGG
jgi:hypothetical protein